MSDIAPIRGSHAMAPLASKGRPQADAADPVRRGTDQAEISPAAQLLGKLADLPPRFGLIAEIREQIADGTYENDQRLDGAVDALIDDANEGLV